MTIQRSSLPSVNSVHFAGGRVRSQSRLKHPCSLGPRLPWRGTLCSSDSATHSLNY
nr:MAG TPA_asm: hypothetical protein [Caudoviricetes sp.]